MSSNIINEAENIEFEQSSKKGPTGDQLRDVLEEAGVVMATPENMDQPYTIAKKFANPDGSINEQLVYSELAELIAEGSQVVKQLRYVDISAEGTLSGMASVLASVRQMIADFAKVHSDYIKHKQRLEVEKFKEDSKMRLLERKHQLEMEKLKKLHGGIEEETSDKKLSYSQSEIIKMITAQKEDHGIDEEEKQ